MSLDLSLYTIESDLANLIEMRESTIESLREAGPRDDNPEIAKDVVRLSEELETIDNQIREYIGAEIRKVDGIRSFWRHCELMRDAAKQEADIQALRSKAWDQRLKRLKETCLTVMETIPFPPGKPKKLEGRTGSIYLKGNGGKQAVVISDESMVPDEFAMIDVTLTVIQWSEILKRAGIDAVVVAKEAKCVRRPSITLISAELDRDCQLCDGSGVEEVYAGHGDKKELPCPDCGGSGKRGVPGASLAARGNHVEVR